MQKGHLIEEIIGTRKALVISVSEYSTNLQALDFCKNDGEEMYELLKSLGYEIPYNHKLVGQVKFDTIRDAIYDFFDNAHTKADDTLIFYYSGHGVPDTDGDIYLASSEIDPDAPYRKGFSFNELTRMMNRSSSIRIVTILDCCYSGAAKISKGLGKGAEEAAAKLGTAAINDKSTNLQKNKGICLLAASQAAQEAYALKEGDHSIFTYYLLEGLKGNEKSVDGSGKVTADTLGKYVHRAIVNLPPEKRPKQTPIRKVEVGDEIVLAHYPKLAEKPVVDIAPIIFEGIKYVNNENYSKAIELYDEAIKINSKSHVGHVYKGYALLKLKKYDEAIKCYDEALEINPKEIDALKNKGLSLSNLSKYNEAIQCYDEALDIDPMDSKVWYYKGSALSQLSKYNEAIKCYDEAIKINPEYSDALRDKGLLEKFAKVVGVEEEPVPPPRADISLILDEGMQYFEIGDYDNAIKSFDKAVSLNPKNPISYNYKGDVFFKLKKYEEAIKNYDAALEINPKYLDVLKDKGLALDNLGKYHEAINCFDAALEINPKIARNWYYKASSLSKLPNNEEAIRCYDEVLKLEPNNIDAWIGKGVCLSILKKYKEAIECYDKAITIDPNNAITHEKKKTVLQIISEETTKSRQQQQQRSPLIGSLSSPSPIQPIPSPSQQQSPIHSHQPAATKDTPSSFSSAIKERKEENKREEQYYYPHTIKEEKKQQKQSWISPKILIPIIAVAIGSVIAFAVFSTTPTPPPPETTTTSPSPTTTTPGTIPETTTTPTPPPPEIAAKPSSPSQQLQELPEIAAKPSSPSQQLQELPEIAAKPSSPSQQLQEQQKQHYSFVRAWGSQGSGNGQFNSTGGIAIDSLNNVYVVDLFNYRIQKFTADGTFITAWGSQGSGNGQFNFPNGIALDSSDNVYVADSGNDRIQKFTSDGTFITAWGSYGEQNGQFEGLEGVAIDSSGNVYVSDDVYRFVSDDVYRLQKFTSDGTFITAWGSQGSGQGQFDSPSDIDNVIPVAIGPDIAIDSSDNVYVADSGNDRIQKFTSDGTFITAWGSEGSGQGQFDRPNGIAIDSSSDNVYVADSGNDRIQKFTSDGKFITTWGSKGTVNGQFDSPSDIAIDSSGYVYVTDSENNRIQVFATDYSGVENMTGQSMTGGNMT